MPTGFEFFERDLRVATAGMSPDQINQAVASYARQAVAGAIAEGIAAPQYERYVNGVRGASEEAFRAPGAIVYQFINWPIVINAAIEELQRRVPRKSGRYAGSFIVITGGRVVTNFSSIDVDAEVIIVNYQPYTRRMDNSSTHGRRHFLLAYHALRRRFGEIFRITNIYLNIESGIHPSIPYILKGSQGRRKDRQAGSPLTYPAIVINAA
ncbi:hypothetical protein [Mesorhizobium amorphae]